MFAFRIVSICLSIFFGFASCIETENVTATAETTSASSVTDTSVDGSAATDEGESTDGGELGTIVGNPTGTKPKLRLTVKTLSIGSDTAGTAADSSSSEEKCRADSGESSNGEAQRTTQKCVGTPREFRSDITAVYLVSCVSVAGEDVTCDSSQVVAISERVPVFSGGLAQLRADDEGATLDMDLAALDRERKFGGVQIVTRFIEQEFPSDPDADADMIALHLKGKSYRLCTAPDDAVSTEEMLALCGQAQARRGDVLFDIDGDGNFGFVDVDVLTPNAITETSTRPDRYEIFVDSDLVTMGRAFSGHPEFEYTDGDGFGDMAGYFAPILPFASVTTVSLDTSYDITATIDIRNTFEFLDGGYGLGYDGICVGALASEGCANGDDDPESVGQYNPYYDGMLVFKTPSANVEVSQ